MIQLVKKILKKLPLAFTQNQRYDVQTKRVIKKVFNVDSNGIDIGCHKGEIFDLFIKHAPKGLHMGFEPIPVLFEALRKKYTSSNHVMYNIALSNAKEQTSFNYVVSNPSYSGLKKRDYDRKDEVDTSIMVQTDLLDNLLSPEIRIDFIKIDVEGGELLVLEGAKKIISKWKPVIIFEHGLGASNHYQSTPDKIFALMQEAGMQIFTMETWLANQKPFSEEEFAKQYYDRLNYYFLAAAKK